MECDKLEAVGHPTLLARLIKQISHENVHFILDKPFVCSDTTVDSEEWYAESFWILVKMLPSSLIKTLTYPSCEYDEHDDDYDDYDDLEITMPITMPEITFKCNKSLWENFNDALFLTGKVSRS